MAEKPAEKLYSASPVVAPSIEELTALSQKLNLKCTDDELTAYRDVLAQVVTKRHKVVDRMTRKTLPVKYPRTPGHHPTPEENPLNAWAHMCNITGAESGKLKGKKVAFKDTIPVAGIPMKNGSRLLESYVPDIDATVVTRVLDAGGCIVGKAACEDLCMSGNSFTAASGPVLNPHKKTHTSGGSSSGCAAVIANGETEMAVAGDQGGSIRIPASWCGVIGMKPTYGLVPYTGSIPIDVWLDHCGPMSNNVENCALLLEVIAGYDNGLDPRQCSQMVVPEYSKLLTSDLKGKKVGLLKEGFENCDEDVVTFVKNAANSLTKAGATVEEISIPFHSEGEALFTVTFLEGVYYTMLQGNGISSGWRGYYPESFQQAASKAVAAEPYDLSTTTKMMYMFGEYMHENYKRKFYAKSVNASLVLAEEYDEALKKYDVLIMPTLPFKARELPKEGVSAKEQIGNALGMLHNTCPFNCTGHPALTINTGFSEGLPIGMMIVGRQFEDSTVLQVAYAYEKIRDQ